MSQENCDFNVTMIQNLEPGWEEEWERIVRILINGKQDEIDRSNSMKKGRLYQACKGLTLEHPEEIEDFVIAISLNMQERVREQKLFQNFDPQKGTVLDFLCSRNYLQKVFQNFYGKERTQLCWAVSFEKNLHPNQEADEWINEVPDEREVSNEQRENREWVEDFMEKIFGDGSLVIRSPSKGSRLYQQAGLQLYLKLSQENQEMAAICGSVRNDVATALKLSDPQSNEALENAHWTAREKWRGKAEICYMKLKKGAFKKESTKECCEKQLSDYTQKRYFCPLETREIVRLLRLLDNNASQNLKRYREKLQFLLEDYRSQYEKIFS